ncbi:MAG: hypothetical protein WCK33_11620 [Phycisphaerae bacterium]|jgi:hypothetical protein
MSTIDRPGDEERFVAASQAAAAERRNNPRYLIGIAGLVLAVSLLWLFSSWSAWSSSRAALVKQQRDRETITSNVAELRALKALQGADSGPRLAEQEGAIRSRLRDIGRAAGLKEENITPKSVKRDQRKDLGSVLLTASFEARDEAMQPLLAWLDRATAEMPGLEVYKISIRPEAQKWLMQVTFSRWEKPDTR